jgi:signal transduction histidine kinase/CheY-like chemotaxis protein
VRGYADDKKVIDSGQAIVDREEDFVDNMGVRHWLLTTKIALHDNNGKIIGMIGVGHDITERKRVQTKLLESYSFNESMLKTIPFAMDIVDETGTVLYQNDIFNILFEEKGIGKKCWDMYKDDKKQCSECPLIKGITIGETDTNESNGVLGNRIFEISHTGMMYDGKKAILEIFKDISERKIYEKKLINAKEKAEESDRLKSAFLTNMSHEIRTPMNGILGFTELLKEPNLTIEEQQDFIQTIGISGIRMLNTINNIVDMSKIESGMTKVDIKETNINDMIEFTYKFFKLEVEKKGLQFLLKTRVPAKDAIINTDNEKVYGILTNLIKNAIKFTDKGSIEFGCDIVKTQNATSLEFFVKDTGEGIPLNQREMIFERFRQGSESINRGYEGSGLGLSICKSYAEMLGGRIWVESEEGKGSTFYFTIPYNPVSEETIAIENVVFTENREVRLKNLKILIEDDEISYALLKRNIKEISKEVLHAITGVEAVDSCQNNCDLDLVLMDIRMPQMNGLEAIQRIRQFNKDIIIIAQTAYGFSSDCEKAIEAGCNDYITKPINKTLLFELIRKHCSK